MRWYSCPANRTNDSTCFLSFMVSPRSSFWHLFVTAKLCRHHIEGTKSENFMAFQVFASEEILIIQLRKESRISFRKVTLNWLKIFLFRFGDELLKHPKIPRSLKCVFIFLFQCLHLCFRGKPSPDVWV